MQDQILPMQWLNKQMLNNERQNSSTNIQILYESLSWNVHTPSQSAQPLHCYVEILIPYQEGLVHYAISGGSLNDKCAFILVHYFITLMIVIEDI